VVPTHHRRAPAHADGVVVAHCVHCGGRLRWRGRRAARTHCPRCRRQLILRRSASGGWDVLPENDDSLAGMVRERLRRRDWGHGTES